MYGVGMERVGIYANSIPILNAHQWYAHIF